MALSFNSHEQAASLETGELAPVYDINGRLSENVTPEDALRDELYDPVEGEVVFDNQLQIIPGGTLQIGTYTSKRASRRIGRYTPKRHNPDTPTVFIDTPLGTSAQGHNARVARKVVARGLQAVVKGPPRYPGVTWRGMSITEDANETLMFARTLKEEEYIPNHDRISLYSESQAAAKALGVMALAEKYEITVEYAHVVAACFYDQINWVAVPRNIRGLLRMAGGLIQAAKELELAAIDEFEGTLNYKDFPHHALVIPHLINGTTGKVIPLIDRQQSGLVTAFGRDVYSDPKRVQERFEPFPHMPVEVFRGRGHVDGILSEELDVSRDVALYELRQKYA